MNGQLDSRLGQLWSELHRRYGASDRPVTSVKLPSMTHDEQLALAELLREEQLRDAPVRLRTELLARALSTDLDGLRELVERQFGQAGNRRAVRERDESARDAARARLSTAAGDDTALAAWAATQAVGSGGGLTTRVEAACRVLELVTRRRAVAVPLPVVAAQTFGDPHALDLDREAGRMLVAALAARAGLGPVNATVRRELLREVGIVADELSSTVIVYRLAQQPGHPLAAALQSYEPVAVTLGQLMRHPLQPAAVGPVLVVENPAVVSAAALAHHEMPLVATSGIPSVAALELVTQLRSAEVDVRAHGDFDAGGLTAVTQLTSVGAAPWRMDVADYRQAAERSTVGLEREPADVSWNPQLAPEIRRVGRVGFEEHLLDVLLASGS